MPMIPRLLFLVAWLTASGAAAQDSWSSLAYDLFGDRPLHDGTAVLALEMPARAENAAIVPVTLRSLLGDDDPRRLVAVTLVIDENPAPVAARFELGPEAGVTSLSTRVRVETYTPVHAVAELSDGSLHVVETFVKASGGCAAPAGRNLELARETAGQMQFRQFEAEAESSARREAQLLLRHPNNSGLQMDQITRLYARAWFVDSLTIRQGDALILAMEGGISLSEDPNLRFDFRPNGAASFRVEAHDTDGHRYSGEWPVAAAQM